MIEQATVLGATGMLGRGVVNALLRRNIRTKVLVRDIKKFKLIYPRGRPSGEVDVLEGDMDSNQALAVICEDADVIFPCFNTEFKNWAENMPRWIARTADVAAALNATVVYPGNTHVFEQGDAKKVTEEHPQTSQTTIGKLSIAIEQRLARSVGEGATVTIVRIPRVFGPSGLSTTISRILMDASNNKKTKIFGDTSSEQELIFSEDVGEVMVNLADNDKAANVAIHLPGNIVKIDDWINDVYKYTNLQAPYYSVENSLSKFMRNLFSREGSNANEILYQPKIQLDGHKIQQILGDIKLTPMNEAIKQTLDWYQYWNKL